MRMSSGVLWGLPLRTRSNRKLAIRYVCPSLSLHPAIAEALLAWRHESAYNADTDYVFASPTMMGKKPLNGTACSGIISDQSRSRRA